MPEIERRMALLTAALRFLKAHIANVPHDQPYRITIGDAGAVIIEWQNEKKYREAEINNLKTVEWMVIVKGQKTKHWTVPLEANP